MGTSTTNSFTSVKGTVIVDMYDASNKQMLFRGSASDTVSDKPEKNAEKISKAMKKVFEKFPPKE
jgi:multisubunit Na+/H+ antiporter MnhE subunit